MRDRHCISFYLVDMVITMKETAMKEKGDAETALQAVVVFYKDWRTWGLGPGFLQSTFYRRSFQVAPCCSSPSISPSFATCGFV